MSFVLLPAVDIRGGRCVRLKEGDFERETVYGEDPLECARRWESEGATGLHVVDLDGARNGARVNAAAVRRILEGVTVPVQVGGGIRTLTAAKEVLNEGATRVVVGTAAVESLKGLRQWVAELGPDQVVVGVDARDGQVLTRGWENATNVDALTFCGELEKAGVHWVLFTDVRRDGMLTGPNLDVLGRIARGTRLKVLASGGIRDVDDLQAVAAAGAAGAIVGTALYDGHLRLADALAAIAPAEPSEPAG